MTGRFPQRITDIAVSARSSQAGTRSAMAVVHLRAFRNNAAAGGQDVNVIEVDVRFGDVYPASNMPVTLLLQDNSGLPATDIVLYADPARTQLVQDGAVTTDQNGKVYLYVVCNAPTASDYMATATALCYAQQPSPFVPLHFTAPAAPVVENKTLEAQPLNALAGQPTTICSMGSLATPLELRLTLGGKPYSSGPFSAALTGDGNNESAGSARLDVPYTSTDGEIRVNALPSRQGALVLTLTDTRTGNHAKVPLKAVVLRGGSVGIAPSPRSVTSPIDGVTFTATMEDIDGNANPAGILLGWQGLDDYSRRLCPSRPPAPTTSDQASRQMRTKEVTADDLLVYPNGQIAVRLEIYGTDQPIGVDCIVPFHPAIRGLAAPLCDVGVPTSGGVLINDGVYINLDGPDIPFSIPTAADPLTDGRSLVALYAHVNGGTPFDPAADIPLACNLWREPALDHDLDMAVPLSSGIFDKNQAIDIYYTMKNRSNTAVSQPLRVIVNRDALDDFPPQRQLPEPMPEPRNYLVGDHRQGLTLKVKVTFRNQYPPKAGDWIQVYLTLSGRTEGNLNDYRSFQLPPYVIQPTDIPEHGPITIEFGEPDGPPGFPASDFDSIDLSDCRLYFTHWNGKTLAVSPYRAMIIDTVTPYSEGAFLQKLLPGPGR